MEMKQTELSKKMIKTIENWVNAGFSVTMENYEPNEYGIIYTLFSIDLNNEEDIMSPAEFASYYYNYMNGISHCESSSPSAWQTTMDLIER